MTYGYPEYPKEVQLYISLLTSFRAETLKLLVFWIILTTIALFSAILTLWDRHERKWRNKAPMPGLFASASLLAFTPFMLWGLIRYYFQFENVFDGGVGMLLHSTTPEAGYFQMLTLVTLIGAVLGFFIAIICATSIYDNWIKLRRGAMLAREGNL